MILNGILFYICTISILPVSIDELVALTGLPVLKILNGMETLINQKMVFEKDAVGRGIYFIDKKMLGPPIFFFPSPPRKKRRALERLIAYYQETISDPDEAARVLAKLYMKTGNAADGAVYIQTGGRCLKALRQRAGKRRFTMIFCLNSETRFR